MSGYQGTAEVAVSLISEMRGWCLLDRSLLEDEVRIRVSAGAKKLLPTAVTGSQSQ